LGTIASSGTVKFVEALKEHKKGTDTNQIGKFGVGFYSAFLVAKTVKVQTRHPDSDTQWVWESSLGSLQYKVYKDNSDELIRGTRVTIELNDDCLEFLDTVRLRGLIKLYSEFVAFPINLWLADDVDKRVVDEEMTKKRQDFENSKALEDGREPIKVEPAIKSEWEKEWKFVVVNENKPIWQRDPKEISITEYNEFYKSSFKEFLDPLALSHFSVEGMYEFKGLIFVPGLAPFDFNRDLNTNSKNIRLYVKRVFISDSFQDDLVPTWLTFIKGVVDSNDLPLNVSREILQESRIVTTIKEQIINRSLKMINSLQGDEEKWRTFWESFGKNIKMGIVEDSKNRKKLATLCQFHTSYRPTFLSSKKKDANNMTRLNAYVSR
jgi:heat shock protein beta